MRVIFRLHFLFLIALIVVFIGSCYKDKSDHRPPDEVTYLKAEPGNAEVYLTWTDPEDPDFYQVEIRFENDVFFVEKGVEELLIQNLDNDYIYRFTVRAVDNNGNKSEGRHAHAKPTAPPEIKWISVPATTLDTNHMGDVNGEFKTIRKMQCLSGTGYINIRVNIIRLSDSSIVSTEEKRFLIYNGLSYSLELIARGDITVYNCTDCFEGEPTFMAEIVSLADNERFTVTPISCTDMPTCNNGMSKKESRWNMISVKYLNLFTEIMQ